MNVIFTPINDRYSGIPLAAAQVFEQVTVWEPTRKPIFDVFEESNPDMVCCDIKYVNSTFVEACNEYKDIKIVLFAEGVPKDFNPHVVCSIPNLSSLLKKHLEAGDHETIYIPDCANVLTHWKGEADNKLECDVAFWSNGNSGEQPIQKLELFSALSHICRIKIAGMDKIPLPQFLGGISTDKVISFLKSSKIAIDWNGDNLLNQAANGIFTLSTIPNSLFPSVDLDNLEKQVTSFLRNSKARKKKAKQAQRNVLNKDTCFHRLAQITEALSLEDHTKAINDKIEELQQCVEG